jgi:hypothetical protein
MYTPGRAALGLAKQSSGRCQTAAAAVGGRAALQPHTAGFRTIQDFPKDLPGWDRL